jgi:hypothetical protein
MGQSGRFWHVRIMSALRASNSEMVQAFEPET